MQHAETTQSLSAHDVRRIAVAGAVHPRTVTSAYRGDTIRSTTRARIEQAARDLGLPPPPAAKVATSVIVPAEVLAGLLALVRQAAREGTAEALAAHAPPAPSTPAARLTLDEVARHESVQPSDDPPPRRGGRSCALPRGRPTVRLRGMARVV